MNSLNADFQTFINYRLDRVGQKLRTCSEYQREMTNNLQDIDDSNVAIINMYQNASYRLGFRDALRLIAGL